MRENSQCDVRGTFFCFGMTVYLACFLFMINYYRVIKTAFREDFGRNFTWTLAGLDFRYVYGVALSVRNGGDGISVHPPLAAISHIPFTFLDVTSAYVVFTYMLLILLCAAIFLCLRENKVVPANEAGLLAALMCTALFYHTYPVLFAIERG